MTVLHPPHGFSSASTDLPWAPFNRRVRPYAFAVSLATLSLVWGFAFAESRAETLLAGAASVSVFWLWAGYWTRRDKFMELGLLASAGVWTAEAVLLYQEHGWGQNVMLALCWLLASGGSYLLEELTDHRHV